MVSNILSQKLLIDVPGGALTRVAFHPLNPIEVTTFSFSQVVEKKLLSGKFSGKVGESKILKKEDLTSFEAKWQNQTWSLGSIISFTYGDYIDQYGVLWTGLNLVCGSWEEENILWITSRFGLENGEKVQYTEIFVQAREESGHLWAKPEVKRVIPAAPRSRILPKVKRAWKKLVAVGSCR